MTLETLAANWRTLFTSAGSALFGLLTIIAALPYELGSMATIIPPDPLGALGSGFGKIAAGNVERSTRPATLTVKGS